MKHLLIRLFMAFPLGLISQSLPELPKLNLNDNIQQRHEIFIGLTSSFAFGDYMEYQRSFGDVTYPETSIKSNIKPLYSATAGYQAVFGSRDTIGPLSLFQASIGANFFRRGFRHEYTSVYEPAGLNTKDKMTFSEIYKINYLSVPLNVRYGKRWFAEAGLSYDLYFFATRKHIIDRKVSGSGAFEGGFEASETTRYFFLKNIFRQNIYGFNLGGGYWLTDKVGLRLMAHYNGNAFSGASKLNTCNLQFELIIKN